MAHDARRPEDLSAIVGPEWAEEFQKVPREHFIPDVVLTGPTDDVPRRHLVDRNMDPRGWSRVVNRDEAIVTQLDDGETDLAEAVGGQRSLEHPHLPTSSNSAPGMVVDFLALLDPLPGDRVLEVGTGTGWTAGLLSARVGDRNVTSVEVDEQVAKEAAANLENAGRAPNLIVGDGSEGWPKGAPYDGVHVTCAVRSIPFSWVEQTRPGGVIVLPWAPNDNGCHKVRLTAVEDSAVGRFHGAAWYMMMRSQRDEYPQVGAERRESVAHVDPRRVNRSGTGLALALAGLLPGVRVDGLGTADDRLGLRDPAGGSYALAVHSGEGGGIDVEQVGPRDLWDELEAAYLTWVRWGEPDSARFGLTVDAEGEHVWIDSPERVVEKVGS